MLLVDAVTSLVPGVSIVGIKNVTGNEPCYAGLRDDAPAGGYAYPASLVMESFGQVAGVLALHDRCRPQRSGEVMLFARVTGFRFSGESVWPGDTLEHHAWIGRILPQATLLRGEVRAGSRRIAEVDRIMVAFRAADAIATGAEAAAAERG
jgi:3-hydroxyacyl-[acyl-carrier-protein] dehydratase